MTSLPNMTRSFRGLLGGRDRFSASPFSDLEKAYHLAHQAVRYFYLASALFLWLVIPELHQLVINNPPLELAWPLFWAEGLPILTVVDGLGVSSATFAALAFWKPSNLLWRVGFAVTLLACAAVPVSLGSVNHNYHEWIWLAFIFVFLPSKLEGNTSRVTKLSYCLTFAAAQGIILMFYTMAGLWKAMLGLISLIRGVPGNFSPDALAWTLADRMAQTNTEPLLGPFFVENPVIAWPMFMGIIYAQVVSIAIAFRPSLHRVWGWILIAFHTGTFVLMEIAFPTHIVILLLLLIASPFQRDNWTSRENLMHLPIFGWAFRRFLFGGRDPVIHGPVNGGNTNALSNI